MAYKHNLECINYRLFKGKLQVTDHPDGADLTVKRFQFPSYPGHVWNAFQRSLYFFFKLQSI